MPRIPQYRWVSKRLLDLPFWKWGTFLPKVRQKLDQPLTKGFAEAFVQGSVGAFALSGIVCIGLWTEVKTRGKREAIKLAKENELKQPEYQVYLKAQAAGANSHECETAVIQFWCDHLRSRGGERLVSRYMGELRENQQRLAGMMENTYVSPIPGDTAIPDVKLEQMKQQLMKQRLQEQQHLNV